MNVDSVWGRAVDLVRQSKLQDLTAEQSAVQVLNRDFQAFDTAAKGGQVDQKISHADLRAVRDGGQRYTEEQRAAAQYFLAAEHADELTALDTAATGGKADGVISRKDVTAYALHEPSTLPLLHSQSVAGSADNPTLLHISAEAPQGASWDNRSGNNAGIVSIYVDGNYVADATILAENPDGMDVNLGTLGEGPHIIEARDSTALGSTGGSAAGVSQVKLSTKELDVNATNQTERDTALAARYAPVITLDDYGSFNKPSQAVDNTPLLTTAQVTHDRVKGTTSITYSVLYSNEDDGYGKGDAKALADNWGRTTDHESVYKVTIDDATGKVVTLESKSLGSDVDKLIANSLNGRPQVTITNGHNNYGWACDNVDHQQNRAFSGAPQLSNGMTTIDVMNENSWTWKVTTEEVEREGETSKVLPNQRLYLNLEDSPSGDFNDHKITVEVTLKDGSIKRYTSEPSSPDSFSIDLTSKGVKDPSQVKSVRVSGVPQNAEVTAQYLDTDEKIHEVNVNP